MDLSHKVDCQSKIHRRMIAYRTRIDHFNLLGALAFEILKMLHTNPGHVMRQLFSLTHLSVSFNRHEGQIISMGLGANSTHLHYMDFSVYDYITFWYDCRFW